MMRLLLLAQRPQIKVCLQQLALQLTALLDDRLFQSVMGQHAGRRVGELSDEPVEGVLRLRKDVSGQAGVVRCLHRALLSPGTCGWHL
ncbi:hypothetical protein [Nonomuraea sp. GTA35]|uniref:hypothetical protein n=1 Tax=Nonomuraea sp. GTA35 TaxID=1676746 RepID=UPI0035C25BF7